MTSNKRTRSISRKINTRSVSKMFGAFLLIDLMIVIMACTLWCVSAEYAGESDLDQHRSRHFADVKTLEKKHPEIKKSDAYEEYRNAGRLNDSIRLPGNVLKTGLAGAFYVFEDERERVQFVYGGTFFLMLAAGIMALLAIELFILLCSVFWGAQKIRRDLEPLDELAFKADMLARASQF